MPIAYCLALFFVYLVAKKGLAPPIMALRAIQQHDAH